MRVICLLISIAIATTTASARQGQANQAKEPVTEEGLIGLLVADIPPRAIIRTIDERGVSFQLFRPLEDELKQAAKHLTPAQLSDLLAAIRSNFRPPNNRPFRVSYRLLKESAVDLLLDGRIDKRWDEALSGKNYIVQNDVFKTLTRLMKMFSSRRFNPLGLSGGLSDAKSYYDDPKLARLYRITRKPLFVGSGGQPTESGPEGVLTARDLEALVRSLNDPTQQWRLAELNRSSDTYVFRKFIDKRDFILFSPAMLLSFYSYITRDYLPPDFAVLDLGLARDEPCGGGQLGKPYIIGELIGPLLGLNIAIIENVSKDPITIGRSFFKENGVEQLRRRDEDRVVLESSSFITQNLFPPAVLKPGEKLVVPLELLLTVDDDAAGLWGFFHRPKTSEDNPADFTSELAEIKRAGGLRFPGLPRSSVVTAESVERMLQMPKIDFLATKEYLYGPSISIEGMEINSYGYLVRHFDPTKLLITSGGDDVGSCPYVYTYSKSDKSWLSEGVILYGNNSKLRESSDVKPLLRFDGRVLIKEKDPEHSFIDLIQIRAIGSDGSETILYPKNVKLRVADEDYVELQRGEQLRVDFEIPAGLIAEKYLLEAKGYYVPYKSGGLRSSQLRYLSRRPVTPARSMNR